ncbi:MAG: hypothetical protein OSB58_11390 [Alphaproteobacteria bacterium]|nr:hypothetical protein [Alphaproteobacteria bacterium]
MNGSISWRHNQDGNCNESATGRGYLYLLDRAGDMIVSGGYNIYPAELENVLCGHDDVVEAAVFAVPDERWGETPMAVCTVVEGATVNADELVQICADALGSYTRPKAVELTHEPLPKSVVGKVQRKVLREPYWEGHERRIAGN